MDPDELADALATAQPQQQAADNDMSWDGRTATNERGERIVWRGTRTRGRFVALNYENADPQSRERVEAVQNLATMGGRVLPQAQRFVERNFSTPTGGIQNSPTMNTSIRALLAKVRPNMFNEADELRALSSQMVGSNWQPGTSGMQNTATEQELVRQRFPSPTNQGPANMDVYLNMSEEVAVQRAAVDAMRQWLTSHTNLQGFDEDFARREPEIRRQARAAANEWARETETRVRGGRRQETAPRRPATVPASYTWDNSRQRWVPPSAR